MGIGKESVSFSHKKIIQKKFQVQDKLKYKKKYLMQAVILAGGLGTRLSEETNLKPKPMVEIGGKPILWHILNIFSKQGKIGRAHV